ncbi:hypothetical protein FB446DRAFT_827763 [Lentinula raphanica]|nr:hypothetical protein FB446DRAFT_827763 [Lentinula raphanica]
MRFPSSVHTALTLTHLDSLVIDEADLVLAYGYDSDIRQTLQRGVYLPKVYQSFLMSAGGRGGIEGVVDATESVFEFGFRNLCIGLNDDNAIPYATILGFVLHLPNAILKLEDGEDEAARLTQYSIRTRQSHLPISPSPNCGNPSFILHRCTEPDKFLLTYIILKLKLIRSKAILFVNDVDRSYRLKLFMEQFSIRSCVLNSELPLNMRYHTVQEFNKGVYNYIVATDEGGLRENDDDGDEDGDEDYDKKEDEGEESTSTQREESTSQSTPQPKPNDSRSSDPPNPSNPSLKRKRGHAEPPSSSSSSSRLQDKKHPKPSTSTSTSTHNLNPPKSSKSSKSSSKEYGVTRGIDFIAI